MTTWEYLEVRSSWKTVQVPKPEHLRPTGIARLGQSDYYEEWQWSPNYLVEMQQLGQQGWELISVVPMFVQGSGQGQAPWNFEPHVLMLLFKRPRS